MLPNEVADLSEIPIQETESGVWDSMYNGKVSRIQRQMNTPIEHVYAVLMHNSVYYMSRCYFSANSSKSFNQVTYSDYLTSYDVNRH